MSKRGKIFFFTAAVSIACFAIIFGVLGTWIPFLWIPIVFTVLSIPLWIYFDKDLLKDFFSMRTTKSGLSMGSLILLVLVIIGLINFIGARKYKTFDFSIAQINSLSDQSKKVVSQLSLPLEIYFFYKPGVEGSDQNKLIFRRLVALYQDVNPKIKFEVIDINLNPKLSQDFKVQSGRGEAFVVYNGRNNKVDRFEEQELTNAILKTFKEKKPIIYFTEGHGEKSTDDTQNEMSAYAIKQLLEKNSFEVKKLSFLQKAQVPSDADLVVILGPAQSFQDFELKAIEEYIKTGGKLIVALDPEKPPVMKPLLDWFGVRMNSHYVFNLVNTPYGAGVDQRVPTVGSVYSPEHPISKVFKNNEITKFAFVGSLDKTNSIDSANLKLKLENLSFEDLVKTNTASVSLQGLDSKSPEGAPRDFTLASVVGGNVVGEKNKFQVVFFADSDFISNILLAQNLNRDLFMNSVSFLIDDVDLISISAKEPLITKVNLTSMSSTALLIGFMSLSLGFLMISVILYFKRKNA